MKKRIFLAQILIVCWVSLIAQDKPTPWYTNGNIFPENIVPVMGSITNNPFALITNNTLRMYVDTNGNIGFNTLSPKQMLHVVDGNILLSHTSRAQGSLNGSILFGAETTPTCPYGVWGIEYVNNENEGYGLNFWKTWNCSTGFNHALFLSDSGNVGIGTKNPQAKLSVNGNICAKEIRVSLNGTPCWPDYVFEEGYSLTSLQDLQKYIKENRHLPDVPSAEEISDSGVNLGEMNTLLLKKIEELTLYIIELEHRISRMEEKGGR